MAQSEKFEKLIKKIAGIQRSYKRLDNHYTATQYYSDKEKLVSGAFMMINDEPDFEEALDMGAKLISVLRAVSAQAA